MNKALRRICAFVAVVVATALGTTAAQAQNEGIKQVEQLIKKATAVQKSIDETKVEVQKSMDAYNAVVAPETTDRKSAYKKLNKQIEDTEKKRGEIPKRIDAAKAEAETLFQGWAEAAATISDPDLKAQSQKRLTDARARLADIQAGADRAGSLYGTFVKSLQDRVTFLGHDLNDTSVANLKPSSAKLSAEATDLYSAIDKVSGAIATSIERLSPK
jgi:chromosome segregation ATPase